MPTDRKALVIDPTPVFDLSPYLYMQFMEPLNNTDSSVEAAWAPPCAAVPAGSSPGAALAAEGRRVGLRLRVGPRVAAVERTLTHRDLSLEAYRCEAAGPRPAGPWRWAPWSRLPRLGLPAAMRALLGEARAGTRPEKRGQVGGSP